ncbi:hypothetical protein ACEWY4_015332 [Coilia grayii]|uniref:Uncharacterized protein n=1 Tax=Coilia grayii TaxID=363190 RepID=A0ABD1JMQ1_9TELE
MDSFRGFESASVCDDEGCVVVDTEWKMEDQLLSDRDLVNTLLDVSEECFGKDQDPDEFGSHIGWEEAVQGWGQGSSVLCLFQTQRRGKRMKTIDAEFHCLLCVDAKTSELQESETTTDVLPEKNTKKTITTKVDLLKTRPSSKSSVRNTVELLQKPNVLTKQLSGFGGLLINSTAAPCLGLSHQQEDQCPVLKDSCASGNVTLINCFTVLPPLKASSDRNMSSPNDLKRGEVTVVANMQDMADILHRGASATVRIRESGRGVDGSGEMKTQAHLYSSRSAEDGLHSSLASKYRTYKNGHRLLTAFSIPIIPKRCNQPFPTMDDAEPPVTYRLRRYPGQEELARPPVRNHSSSKLCLGYKTKHIRRVDPKLPMLFGTRVAIPASAHRL